MSERSFFLLTPSIHPSDQIPCVVVRLASLFFFSLSFCSASRSLSRAGPSSPRRRRCLAAPPAPPSPSPPPSPPLPSCSMSIPSARCHFHCGRARSERRVRTSGWFTAPFRSFYYPILVYRRALCAYVCMCVNPAARCRYISFKNFLRLSFRFTFSFAR